MSAGTHSLQESEESEIGKIIEQYDWEVETAYRGIVEDVWRSEAGKLYVEDTSHWDNVDHDRRLMYLEGRFNPDCVAVDEEIDEYLEKI